MSDSTKKTPTSRKKTRKTRKAKTKTSQAAPEDTVTTVPEAVQAPPEARSDGQRQTTPPTEPAPKTPKKRAARGRRKAVRKETPAAPVASGLPAEIVAPEQATIGFPSKPAPAEDSPGAAAAPPAEEVTTERISATPPKPERAVPQPLSPAAQVEATDRAIVIKFPPAARSPFQPKREQTPASRFSAAPPGISVPAATDAVVAPPPPADEAVQGAPSAPPEPAAEPTAERGPDEPTREGLSTGVMPPPTPAGERGRRRRRARRDRRPPPPPSTTPTEAPAPAGRPGADLESQAFQRLSPSQKRRLRRKRRAELVRQGEVQPTSGPAAQPKAAVPAEPPPAARVRPQPPPRVERMQPEQTEAGPVEELDQAPAPVQATAESVAGPAEAEEAAPRPRRRSRRARQGKRAPAPAPAEPQEEPQSVAATAADLKPVSAGKEMVINFVPNEECRIGILSDGKLEEIYLERASAENHVGNIYKGIITNVEASIQAAFIDFGLAKNGFLHITDLHPMYFPSGGGQTEQVGRKMPRRSRPPIQRCLRRGQEMIIQVTKEGIGTKGPTLSTYLSIPGRFMVMMPGMRRLGVSRKIEDDDIRSKLRDHLEELNLPEGVGFIARTAAQDRTKRELQSDLNYLSRLWKTVEKRRHELRAPAELYRESDLVTRTIRDVFTSDIGRIVVDDHEVAERAREFLSIFSPRSRDAVVEYTGGEPIFHKYRIEEELERLHSRHVPLKSGGSLVIDQTEALVAIDVNSGRFRTEDDAETTAYKINLEAADEIPRQLRLRDLGGVVICDFIDMRQESHRHEIERRLTRNLKEHKERAKVLRMSSFGIVEMTRQRQRASLMRSVYQDCPACRGSGMIKTPESVILDAMRLIQLAATREEVGSIQVRLAPDSAHRLQNRKRTMLHRLESENRCKITIEPDTTFAADHIEIECLDQRSRVVPHA